MSFESYMHVCVWCAENAAGVGRRIPVLPLLVAEC